MSDLTADRLILPVGGRTIRDLDLFGGPQIPHHPKEKEEPPTPKPTQLLKVTGEFFRGEDPDDLINDEKSLRVAQEVAEATDDYTIGIVVGGGNIWRGKRNCHKHMTDEQADYMGMLATLMNAQALEAAFIGIGCEVRLVSAIRIDEVTEHYKHKVVLQHLRKERVVIFACGSGHPHCTTDYTAALRAADIKATVLHKATHGDVNGVFSADPKIHPDAVHLPLVSYDQALREGLDVMDPEAFSLCRKQSRGIHVFSIETPGSITRALYGECIGSFVTAG